MPQHPSAKTPERGCHDGEHRGLDAEKDGSHRHSLLIADVKHAESKDNQRPRQDKQYPGDNPTAHPVQKPAKIDGKLLRFRTGKQHAEIQRMKEATLADPFQFVNQQPVHHGDLTSRPAEAQQADLQPDGKRLAEPDAVCLAVLL